MRLLHVHDFFAPGNSRFGFDMDRLLAARGHDVHVLAAVGERGPSDGSIMEGVAFHTYPHLGEGSAFRRYRYAMDANEERFEALHAERPFDLIVLNQPLCAAGVLSAPSAEGVPRAYWFISPWEAEWLAEHPRAGALARFLQGGMRRRLERNALRRCDAVLVESRFIRDRLFRHHPFIPPAQVSLVPGAVDLERFRPGGSRESHRARFGIGPGRVVLTVRRLVERMGIDLLIRAVAALPGTQLVVGGAGPRRAELEALASELGVPARFLGFVPDEDLPSLYRAADLFVLPTRELEGFGLVAVEAMACGTPAMGTPVGAIPEVLGDLGLVFDAVDEKAIAAGIRRFFDAPDPALPERCRRLVGERYDWARVIETLEETYRKVAREGAGHGRG